MTDTGAESPNEAVVTEPGAPRSRWRSRTFRVLCAVVPIILVAGAAFGCKWIRDTRTELLQHAKDTWGNIHDDGSANFVAHDLVRFASQLKALPGFGTFGSADPELLRSIARGLAPHLAQLAGASGQGFTSRDIHPFSDADSMRDLFSILDQDRESAIIANASAVVQCVMLMENTGQYGVYDDLPSALEVAGRLKQVMAEGAEEVNLIGEEAKLWRSAREPGAAEKLADAARSVLYQVPGFAGTLDDVRARANLANLVGARKQDPSSDLSKDGAGFMKDLAHPLVLNNTLAYESAVLQGLIKAHPEVAADPDLLEYITDGRIDAKKLVADEKSADTKIANAASRNLNKYGLSLRQMLDQERLGSVRNWSG
ncbi:Uncharacterised protein [Mycobacteroides abscessus subsp. bolletii]|uniref:hypothetical protein n=1 Tax=Mycobacteroides abscessus TaxID=36809 RepID=UPI0009D23C98|nr:hypothetical protein [Mycobacteroides abscessus]SKV07759.1 Uncharacterised protein [Mycobacteroides abscessus subsp. bolletii]